MKEKACEKLLGSMITNINHHVLIHPFEGMGRPLSNLEVYHDESKFPEQMDS